ncbi:MAG: 30S ribosome-binding factor RbfA [Fibrobacteria bacterium]|nr:30S ribosome-binding factor RbfA [Fibrobacteria bacterium]
MSGSPRALQIGELIRRELAKLSVEGLKDPRIGFVTFSGVKVSRDMSVAMVNFTVLGSDKQVRDSVIGLQQSGGWLRRELSRRLRLRHMPELRFVLDHNLENSMHINELLAGLPEEDRKEL